MAHNRMYIIKKLYNAVILMRINLYSLISHFLTLCLAEIMEKLGRYRSVNRLEVEYTKLEDVMSEFGNST
jgi:hypothetical protein